MGAMLGKEEKEKVEAQTMTSGEVKRADYDGERGNDVCVYAQGCSVCLYKIAVYAV
jgi:hypothetical protein